MPKTERKSGIELLRIIAAFFVVVLHYNSNYAFKTESLPLLNRNILYFLESISICAVDLFVLISGFFMFNTNKRSINKPLELLFQVSAFKIVFYFASVIVNHKSIVLRELILHVLPNNYFVFLYTTVYFVSPYINMLLKKFTSRMWKTFLIIMLALFSIWPTFIDLMSEICNLELMGISTITAWGNYQGFNIVNFILLYCTGAFLNYSLANNLFNFSKTKLFFIWISSVILIFIWTILTEKLHFHGLRSAWCYHNPLVILSASTLFLIFNKIDFSSKVVNSLSKASFICFLIHQNLLNFAKVSKFVVSNPFVMLLHLFITVIIVYVVSYIASVIYNWFSKVVISRIKVRTIIYEETL